MYSCWQWEKYRFLYSSDCSFELEHLVSFLGTKKKTKQTLKKIQVYILLLTVLLCWPVQKYCIWSKAVSYKIMQWRTRTYLFCVWRSEWHFSSQHLRNRRTVVRDMYYYHVCFMKEENVHFLFCCILATCYCHNSFPLRSKPIAFLDCSVIFPETEWLE